MNTFTEKEGGRKMCEGQTSTFQGWGHKGKDSGMKAVWAIAHDSWISDELLEITEMTSFLDNPKTLPVF